VLTVGVDLRLNQAEITKVFHAALDTAKGLDSTDSTQLTIAHRAGEANGSGIEILGLEQPVAVRIQSHQRVPHM